MKRSNRLVLLIGVFLAIVAFVGILLISTKPPEPSTVAPTTLPTVIATADIPLGTKILAEQLTVQQKDVNARSDDAFGDPAQVVGQIARVNVVTGAEINARTLGQGGVNGQILNLDVPPGLRAIAVQVDQVTGVGTVIKTGDYVDMVIGLSNFPVITVNPSDQSITSVAGLNSTSVKVLIQGMQVLGTLLPPPEATTAQPAASGAPAEGSTTALNGQQEIVILAVDAQQAELIKFAQIETPPPITLILRSPDDFVDPTTHLPITPVPDETTGVILKTLVDTYGVLPPELVETVLPAQASPRP